MAVPGAARLRSLLVLALSATLVTTTGTIPALALTPATTVDRGVPALDGARVRPGVIGARRLGPAGGTVKAANGVAIRVPRGVMRFPGRVEIRRVDPARYDFHIYARWKGKVEVRLPKVKSRNLIVHEVRDGRWVLEKARSDGKKFAVARVSSLSSFSNLLTCIRALRPSPGAAVNVVKCLEWLKIRVIPQWLVKKILANFNEYDACRPVSLTNWTLDALEVIVSSCRLSAPSCEYSGTCGTPEPPPATPPPPPPTGGTPAPTPTSPAPTNPTFTGGYFVQDSYLGGTWPRTDPWNGTWYSRSNRPPNAADYWWANGLGVGFRCGQYAASYTVRFADGRTETWNTWLRSTDTWGGRVVGLWMPSAVARGINTNGLPPGMPVC